MDNIEEIIIPSFDIDEVSHFLIQRRERRPETWKRNVQKRCRAEGKQYYNSKNELVPERTIGEDCLCRKQCFSKFTDEEKMSIFKSFYDLADKEKQDTYLRGLVTREPVKRKRPRTGVGHQRSTSFSYILRVQDKTVEVCKQAVVSIHGITRSRLDRILALSLKYLTGPPDLRGHHNNRPRKMNDEILTQLYHHIISFIKPNSRSNTKVCFIGDLSPRELYNSYMEKYDNREKPTIKYSYFYRFLHSNFNFRNGRCGRPKSNLKSKEKIDDDEELIEEIVKPRSLKTNAIENENEDSMEYHIVKVIMKDSDELCVKKEADNDGDIHVDIVPHYINKKFQDKLELALQDVDLSADQIITVTEAET